MPAAARLADAHSCPLTIPAAHVGGVIVGPGVSTVSIGYRSAVTEGSTCACGIDPSNRITKGSSSVVIARRPAARMGDPTSHGGVVTSGCVNVSIG
jgi:uncharacterized Zn-binding protein involved in type VI secretion